MILLDTHTLVWALEDHPRLGPRARDLIASSSARFVSSISHAEATIKAMRGKLRIDVDFPAAVAQAGFESLPLHDRHVAGLRAFESLVGHDPFNRLLIAQAHVDRLTLVTADRVLLEFDGTFDATR